MSELLEGHDDLIEGFNSFLPSNEKIDKQAEASQEDDEDEEDEDDEDGDDEQRKVRSTGGGGRGSTTNELANAKNFIERARVCVPSLFLFIFLFIFFFPPLFISRKLKTRPTNSNGSRTNQRCTKRSSRCSASSMRKKDT